MFVLVPSCTFCHTLLFFRFFLFTLSPLCICQQHQSVVATKMVVGEGAVGNKRGLSITCGMAGQWDESKGNVRHQL